MLEFKDVKILDINSAALGVTTEMLMENAGRAVAAELKKRYRKNLKITFFCGTGNNAGDAFAAARYLKDWPATTTMNIVLLKEPAKLKKGATTTNFKLLQQLAGKKLKFFYQPSEKIMKDLISKSDLIVDALFGVGIKGTIGEPYASCIRLINASRKQIVSIDVPSGIDTNIAVQPTITITFHDLKKGMCEEKCGEIVVADIGIPEEAVNFIGPGEFINYPIPSPTSHKGENGKVLIVGGGPYTGAPALAGLAAYRTGVDLVKIAVPSKIHSIIAAYSPNFIVQPLNDSEILTKNSIAEIINLSRLVDCVVVGSGLGNAPATLEAAEEIFKKIPNPIVVDADALAVLDKDFKFLSKAVVLTPHHNEFRKITGKPLPSELDAQAELVKEYAAQLGVTILLKGPVDIISNGVAARFNKTGNAGMTVGGSGDVLAGIVGGLLAKGLCAFDAAKLAAFISGSAGDYAFRKYGYSLLATDIVDAIHKVLKNYMDVEKDG